MLGGPREDAMRLGNMLLTFIYIHWGRGYIVTVTTIYHTVTFAVDYILIPFVAVYRVSAFCRNSCSESNGLNFLRRSSMNGFPAP